MTLSGFRTCRPACRPSLEARRPGDSLANLPGPLPRSPVFHRTGRIGVVGGRRALRSVARRASQPSDRADEHGIRSLRCLATAARHPGIPEGNYRHRLPSKALFLVEVAVTSFAYDRDVKCPLYAEQKVPEYWLVDLKKGVVHVYDRARKGIYSRRRTYRATDTVSPGAFPDIEISVADFLP